MYSPVEVILVPPQDESSSTFAATIEILDRFGIGYRRRDVSPPFTNPEKEENAFCVILSSEKNSIEWANHFYPSTPKLLVPRAKPSESSLEALVSAANQSVPHAMPVFAFGKAGEINAALFAMEMLALERRDIRKKLLQFRKDQTRAVLARPIPGE